MYVCELSIMQCPCAILSSVASLALEYFSTLSHKRQDFLHVIEYNYVFFDFLYKFCLNNFLF